MAVAATAVSLVRRGSPRRALFVAATAASRAAPPAAAAAPPPPWFVYVLDVGGKALYTGVTTDVQRRVREQAGGRRGAKALRGARGNLTLVLVEEATDRSAALRREAAIKRLPRHKKLELVARAAREATPPDASPGVQ